ALVCPTPQDGGAIQSMVQVVVRTGKSGLASWPRQQPNASARGHLRLSTVGALQPSPRQPQRQGPMDPGQPVNSKTPSSSLMREAWNANERQKVKTPRWIMAALHWEGASCSILFSV